MSPFDTTLSPPVNKPAEYNLPVIASLADAEARKHPLTVPELVMENDAADDSDLLPAAAAENEACGRVDCEYAGTTEEPDSFQPLVPLICAAVSPTATAVYEVDPINPIYQTAV